MNKLTSKAIIYDSTCPMCTWYTGAFVNAGALDKKGRIAFSELDHSTLAQLDPNRARHEIPLLDRETGEIVYGMDSLTLILANMFPWSKGLITKTWFKNFFKPLYKFISYNRRVIAGTGDADVCWAPDFSLPWRLALIGFGYAYVMACVYLFAILVGINNIWPMYAGILCYFVLLTGINMGSQNTMQQKWDYMGHMATMGIIEGTLFMVTALIGHFTGYTALLFASHGAARLFTVTLHAKRVRVNHYNSLLSYAFAFGAIWMVVIIAILKTA